MSNQLLKFKPAPKRNRMAVILASKHKGACYFCGNPLTIAVSTVDDNWIDERFKDHRKYREGIRIRHVCVRHRLFGYWPGPDKAWGWD